MNFKTELLNIGKRARAAGRTLAALTTVQKNAALKSIAAVLLEREPQVTAANAKDLEAGKNAGLSEAMLDRLTLNEKRFEGMEEGLQQVVQLNDPVGQMDMDRILYNGLDLRKIRVPIGVIGIIYESRPNVTIDSAALCLKAGNAVILRGGKEAIHSNRALAEVIAEGCERAGISRDAVQLIPWIDRSAINELLKLDEYVDCIIPRGGEGLIRFVTEHARMPVIKHYKGVCHLYFDKDADIEMALNICENAKVQRPGVCNALETILIHRDVAATFIPLLADRLEPQGVEFHGDEAFREHCADAIPAVDADWPAEYLDLRLAAKVVNSMDDAMDHIATYGSGHSDSIVSTDDERCERFLKLVDSAVVYANASTRFTDGQQFGMGAEIGISTDRIHARGPMGVVELTTYKYQVRGDGQIRD
jgi:glutamate-5-semialdehyde dehydrogenase